tara:strand:+ start:81 stop:236 length:156 start_codon:yes stop_codon:yes gene_type:complete
MKYMLVIKSSGETIDRIKSDSHKNAYNFFIGRKQMNEEAFNKLYEVKIDEE